MKRFITIMLLMANLLVISAQNVNDVLKKTIAPFEKGTSFSANYSVKSQQGKFDGTIIMQGVKFRILSPEVKCWYNGDTQWSYSANTNEVSVTEPSQEELQMSNPYVAMLGLKKTCNAYMAFTQIEGKYTLKFVPKKKNNEIKQVLLYVKKANYIIEKVYFEMKNGSTFSISLSDVKNGVKCSKSTFELDKSLLPQNIQIIDLK